MKAKNQKKHQTKKLLHQQKEHERKNKNTSSIIVDTGCLLAIFDKKDQYHQIASTALEKYNHFNWITTWFVLGEICYHFRHRGDLIESLMKAQHQDHLFDFFYLKQENLPSLAEIMKKYSNRSIDLADASLILLAEKLGHGDILTTDSDFNIYRWAGKKHFNNLLIV